MTRIAILLALLLVTRAAPAAITFFGSTHCPTDGNSNTTGPYACAAPTSMVSGDLVLAFPSSRNNGDSITNSTTGGQTWTVLGTADENNGGGLTVETYCAVFNGSWAASPAWDFFWAEQFNQSMSVDIIVYRPSAGFSLDCTPDVAVTYNLINTTTAMSITGQTPTASASVVTLAAWRWYPTALASALTGGWTTRGSDDDIYNTGGGDNMARSFADKIQASASATGTVAQTAASTIDGIGAIMTFKETALPSNKVVNRHGRVGGPEVIR